ncbi:MFS general substrate transporter [Neolentinus lepideus HHB14362 ss-1]|uniref:MFS general substrate transporter n=1 Tax=Neolentinus lepideus HHB14362 ss-1 TaxID=1314782 RepID=A0A165RF71_9AGAM|nr:MFS general substrate transporter [Neolentinus lepideus HHB14362 ss-1]
MSETIDLKSLRSPSPSSKVQGHANDSKVNLEDASGLTERARVHRGEQEHTDVAGETSEVPSKSVQIKAHIQFIALCYSLFLAGWNDGTTGPLLPRIQRVYHVGFAVVSLIFISNCIGFIAGATANVALTHRLGFGKVIVLGAALQAIAYTVQAPAPPFPVFAIAFAINGFGIALQDAQANGFVASLKANPTTKMGIMHAVYGLGALCAPLVSTHFSQLRHWSYHYLFSLGIAVSCALVLGLVFRFKTQDECYAEIGQAANESGESAESDYKQIFRLKAVHLLAIFSLIYVGVEVTIGGWTVTYIIDVRHGGASSGYISSGFFGGLTVGRVALLWVNHKVGERTVLFIYGILALALELVIWFVPSLIGGAVTVSIVGILLGPMYPIIMNHSGRILPRWLLTGCIGWIAGLGQAGSALIPFITGAFASRFGIVSLQPVLVTMMACMLVLWAIVPNTPRRPD